MPKPDEGCRSENSRINFFGPIFALTHLPLPTHTFTFTDSPPPTMIVANSQPPHSKLLQIKLMTLLHLKVLSFKIIDLSWHIFPLKVSKLTNTPPLNLKKMMCPPKFLYPPWDVFGTFANHNLSYPRLCNC